MTYEQFSVAFADFVKKKGFESNNVPLNAFPRIFIDYYREISFEKYSKDNADDDMLLFQYGCYDWGKGRFFEVDFTRQYYKTSVGENDAEVIQQRFTFYFDPTAFDAVTAFNFWSNTCDHLSAFESKITDSEGYVLALHNQPLKFETTVEDA